MPSEPKWTPERQEAIELLRLICQRASEPKNTTASAVPVATVPWSLIERACNTLAKIEGES